MQGYKRKITKRYYDYDRQKYAYSIWQQAVITNNIDKYQKKKQIKFKPMDGELYDWYEFIEKGVGTYYISIEKVYEWEVYIDEQQGIL